jgi:hypothetical protein
MSSLHAKFHSFYCKRCQIKEGRGVKGIVKIVTIVIVNTIDSTVLNRRAGVIGKRKRGKGHFCGTSPTNRIF